MTNVSRIDFYGDRRFACNKRIYTKNGFGKLKSLKLCFGTLSENERKFPHNLTIRNNKTEAVQLFGWALKLILKSSVPIAWISVHFYCVYKSNRSFSLATSRHSLNFYDILSALASKAT